MNNRLRLSLLTISIIAIVSFQPAFADYQEKLDFAAGLEETLGHFWALERNLDENNAELAVIHATHPVAELYDAMKPVLQETDAALDSSFGTILLDLKEKATVDVSRAQAQEAIDAAKEAVELARTAVVGDALSGDPHFKLELMRTLLETSIAEYGEAVSDGIIIEMAEFQDGSAFVWRSQQIFGEIRSDLDSDRADEIETLFADVWSAYDSRADLSVVDSATGAILNSINEVRQEKLDFAAGLEETLGHFWALERNLDENNAELAVIHATHPVAELYDAMKPVLQETDAALDSSFGTILLDLKEKATVDVSRAQAQEAIDAAKEAVELARTAVVGDALSGDPHFKLELMRTLLETSIAEYGEAVSDGIIIEMAEFQDGSAFVWRSQQIFGEIRSDIDSGKAAEIAEYYEEVWAAYDSQADPSVVDSATSAIISEIGSIVGTEEGAGLIGFVDEIRRLLAEAQSEYREGNRALALSLATKAYLDNYEFLEAPLLDVGERELMLEVEEIMRVELRSMIREGASTSAVDAHIGSILSKIDTVAAVLGVGQLPLGDSWNALKGELSAAEKADTLNASLEHLQSARDIYTDVFQEAAQSNDAADDELIIGTLSESERLLGQGDINQVKLNRQIIDKTIYKIAYHEIENAIAANDADGLLRWFDVMEKKFKFSENDYGTNSALIAIGSSGSITSEHGETIKSDLLGIFKIKTFEEIEEAIQALNGGDTEGAKKFAYEGLYYYRTLHPDVERELGSDSAAELLHEMEEVIEIVESSLGTADKIRELQTIGAEVELILREYEGGDTSELGVALSGMRDRLNLVNIEYVAAVEDGQIIDQQEYDETVVFLTRTIELYNEQSHALSALSESDSSELISTLNAIDRIVTSYGDPSEVTDLVKSGLGNVEALQELSGIAVDEDFLLTYVDEIRRLLTEAKSEYRQGNSDLAFRLVTQAYLDNYEFLEGPLADAGERELMLEVEGMMREDLRAMIRAGAPVSQVDAQIDAILERMDTVAVIVPEFGPLVMLVLVVAIVSIIAITARSRIGLTPRY